MKLHREEVVKRFPFALRRDQAGVLVPTLTADVRVKPGAQVVQMLVKHGFLGEEKLKNLADCGVQSILQCWTLRILHIQSTPHNLDDISNTAPRCDDDGHHISMV